MAAPNAESRPSGLTRRSFLAAGAGAAAGALASRPGPARASGGKVLFGGALMSDHMDSDPSYVQAFLDHCDLVMPMNELKADLLRPDAATFRFGPADRIVDLALSNGLSTRGHALLWFGATPPWMEAIDDPAELERVLVGHIETVMDRYRGRMTSWDVVNEAIAFEPTDRALLRDTSWLRVLGPRHIPIAFRAAERADPKARLVLNDYDLEFKGPRFDLRREIALSIVRQLQDANIRIDGVGIQGHLYAEQEIDVEALAAFGQALKRLGVRLLVTELDVIDWKIEGGAEEQDAAAYRIVGDLLDGVFAAGPPEAVVAWGITDRYSWIPGTMPRPDGKPCRPLPLDADLKPKSWHGLIERRLQV
ncbi:1,4-beta-xylanase [Aureimonas sp. Leaf460]|nr:1,4-beta-xylanase [Aureimonas sp. Leaf427]KQT76290.1 1,4-beta-xylanase [Aureimonas sp. Leaf460]